MTVYPHPARLLKRAGQPFDYPTKLQGKTPDGVATVYYDPTIKHLGADTIAAAVLAVAPRLIGDCESWFGIKASPFNVIVAPLEANHDGTGGAYHYGCDFKTGGDIYVDFAIKNAPIDIGLTQAELSEAFMGTQGKGWNCGGSGGEALSRLMGEIESGGANGALAAFTSAPSWVQAGMPNWIDRDQGTDGDYPSIGCGMVYLSWMQSLGYSVAQITQAGEPHGTLASNYKALTGKDSAWADFMAAVGALGASNIRNDAPFSSLAPPTTALQRRRRRHHHHHRRVSH